MGTTAAIIGARDKEAGLKSDKTVMHDLLDSAPGIKEIRK
jgi:hypothetical protein